MNKRIEYIDALKGFAIFCVLWGHLLQYMISGANFFHNQMFEFIYSFHMPLFFMISGFFFTSSLKFNMKDFLLKKGTQLLLPCMVWAAILSAIPSIWHLINEIITGNGHPFKSTAITIIKHTFNPFGWFWFLRELFISYFLVYVSLKMLKKQWLACLLTLCFVLIMPYGEMQRFLLPVFWIGIFLKENYLLVQKYANRILGISGLIFVICLLFWDGNYTIYVTGFARSKLLDFQFAGIAFFRLLIGTAGSIFFMMLFRHMHTTHIVSHCAWSGLETAGKYTMGIYLLHTIILDTLINRFVDFPTMNIYVYNFVITPLTALVIGFVCVWIVKLLNKNKYLGMALIGTR